MSEKPFISIIVPLLNEEENVGPLHDRLTKVLSEVANGHEIIFVDDGSTDGSVACIEELHEKDATVKLVSFSRNFGHQFALTAGLDHARGGVVITMDADLQHPPETIPALLEQHREGFEVVSGVKKGASRRSFFLELTAVLYYFLLRRISSIPIDAHASDFRLMDRKVVLALRQAQESTRFLRGLVKWLGFRSTTVPYQPAARHGGRTAYTLRKRIELGVAGLLAFSPAPLRVCKLAGVLLLCIAIAFRGMAAVSETDLTGSELKLAAILVLGGVQLLFMGLAGENLGRTYMKARRRPIYVVRRRLGVEPER